MEIIKDILEFIPSHWPWFTFCLVMTIVSEVIERILIDKRGNRPVWLFWPRRLQALFPIVLGFVFGYFVPFAEKGIITQMGNMAYYGSAGIAALFAYDIIVGLLKKQGIQIKLPGDSIFPTAPPPPKGKDESK